MTMSTNIGDREYQKFVELPDGNVAIRTTATISGDVNVDSTSINLNAYIGKPTGGNGDFVTAYTAATQITMSSLPAGITNINASDIETIRQISSAGAVLNTYSRDDVTITVAANVITVAGATFGATDTFIVFTNISKPAGGSDIDDAAFTMATDKGQVIMGINTSDSVDSGDKGALAMTTARELKTFSKIQSDGTNPARVGLKSGVAYNDYALNVYDMANSMCMPAEYGSPFDFTATYTSSTSITITGTSFTVDDANCFIVGIVFKPTGGTTWTRLVNGHNGVGMVAASGVITVSGYGTPFASGDTYRVAINYQKKAYDSTTDVYKIMNQNPDSSKYVIDSLLDTTNVTAATNYYPSATGISMDGYRDWSLTGKFIDADNTTTMSWEGTNDEDTTNADWVPFYGYDTKNNTVVSSIVCASTTVTFALDFDNCNYSSVRVKIVNGDNTNTMIVKSRRKAL